MRRRYGWAALRCLRRGIRAALSDHLARSLGGARYSADGELLEIRAHYNRAVRRLRERWPALALDNPRAQLDNGGALS